jgi:hypothetical protein
MLDVTNNTVLFRCITKTNSFLAVYISDSLILFTVENKTPTLL